ncbi:unnamed protein product [Staurois parvus]|uniref:C2H2-type domain-containing protein n=1 Tax=Staurois parvus TaxID=386267 RepID=A0ABN9EI50_9NEOB|nr:unnamed protein product [Staurois parvus]
MMENHSPVTSPDGSSNGNPPERCPSPLYSLDSIQERSTILRCYQYKRLKHITEVKKEAKSTSLKDEKPCKVEEVPRKISPDTGDTRETLRSIKAKEEEEVKVKIRNEGIHPGISTDTGNTRETPRSIQADNEERRLKAKRKILEIGMDGRYRWYNTEKYPDSEIVDDDITAYVAKEKAMAPNLQAVGYKVEKPYSCPDCGKRFTHEKYLIIHYRSHSGEKPFFCAECGKSFPYRSSLDKHKITHTAVGAFPCPECGKRFRAGWILAAHQRVHSSENVHR